MPGSQIDASQRNIGIGASMVTAGATGFWWLNANRTADVGKLMLVRAERAAFDQTADIKPVHAAIDALFGRQELKKAGRQASLALAGAGLAVVAVNLLQEVI